MDDIQFETPFPKPEKMTSAVPIGDGCHEICHRVELKNGVLPTAQKKREPKGEDVSV